MPDTANSMSNNNASMEQAMNSKKSAKSTPFYSIKSAMDVKNMTNES